LIFESPVLYEVLEIIFVRLFNMMEIWHRIDI
jgi:hypothetical protein